MALQEACSQLRANAVRELELGRNVVGDSGAREMAQALKENNSLTSLGLRVAAAAMAMEQSGSG